MRLATGPDRSWGVILEVEGQRCRIRDVLSGDTRWVAHSTLTIPDAAALEDIGQLTPQSARQAVSAIRTARGWGVVLVVGAASPVPVRELLAATTECESDLNGLLAELEAGGVLDRTAVGGERAYELSGTGRSAVHGLWSSA